MTNPHPHVATPAGLGLVLILLGLSCAGCNTGANIDPDTNTVQWVTWDEGHGTRKRSIPGADPETFRRLTIDDDQQFGRDRDHVYLRETRIDGADPDSFRKSGDWYRDDHSVFLRVDGELKHLPDSHPNSFRRLDPLFWSRDDTRVFFKNRGFVPRDMASFELLHGFWARDNETYYYQHRELPTVDRETFAQDETWITFARDRNHVYWKGVAIPRCDPESFVATTHDAGHDSSTRFHFIWKDERNYGPEFREGTIEVNRHPLTIPDAAPRP